LELAEQFILCDHQAYKAHIKGIAFFVHDDDSIEVTHGRFTEKGSNVDMPSLESGI
jgi:hypothetical protein